MKKKRAASSRAEKSLTAMKEAFRKLLLERIQEGVSLSTWKDGKLEVIPARKLKNIKFRS